MHCLIYTLYTHIIYIYIIYKLSGDVRNKYNTTIMFLIFSFHEKTVYPIHYKLLQENYFGLYITYHIMFLSKNHKNKNFS